MNVILLEKVENLGDIGDLVTVKPGYGRNYLLPQGLATVATDHHKRMVEKHRARLLEIEKKRLSSLQDLANGIGQQSITIEANANDEGHLYGSVGAAEIVSALKKGYQMGLDRIDEALQPLGVTEIVCDGKPFDPRVMKAADIEETGKVPDGTVLEVYRTGYMIDTEVLQPAQVKVARTPRKE